MGKEEVKRLEDRFGIDAGEIDPRVFWRITENWLELTVRFLGPDHGIRKIKDQMTREIMTEFKKAHILIAAVRQEGVTMPHPEATKVSA